MASQELDRFGELVVTKFRDSALEFFDRLAKSQWKAAALQELQGKISTLDANQVNLIRRCVEQSLDNGIHDFLFALVELHDDNREVVITVNGKDVIELSDGLHGESYGSDGWIARFGKYPQE